jgi:hypothetical protein
MSEKNQKTKKPKNQKTKKPKKNTMERSVEHFFHWLKKST